MAQLEDTTPTAEELSALKEKMGYTPEEVALLTPEERAELMADDGALAPVVEGEEAEPVETKKTARGDADLVDDTGMPHAEAPEVKKPEAKAAADAVTPEAKEAAEAAAAAKDAEAKAAAEAEGKKEGEEATTEDTGRRDRPLRIPLEADRDFDAEMAAVDAKTAKLMKEWGDGDITNEEYAQRDAALRRESNAIIREQAEASVSAKINQQAAADMWQTQQDEFLEENPGYAPPEKGKVNARFSALNEYVKTLARDPVNEHKSGRWHLNEAKRLVEAEFGPVGGKPAAKDAPKPAEAPKPPERKKPDLKAVPTTLAHVPSASDPDTGGSEFDHIDNLEGIEQERAIARLSPERLDAYLRRDAA